MDAPGARYVGYTRKIEQFLKKAYSFGIAVKKWCEYVMVPLLNIEVLKKLLRKNYGCSGRQINGLVHTKKEQFL